MFKHLAMGVLVGAAVATSGCGGGDQNVPPVPVPSAPAVVQQLSLFVANAEVRGAASDPNYADKLRGLVETKLKAAGYKLVDVASPHDATVEVVAQQDKDHPEIWHYTLRIVSGDETIEQTDTGWEVDDETTTARLVGPLARSEHLVAFAARAHGVGAPPAAIVAAPPAPGTPPVGAAPVSPPVDSNAAPLVAGAPQPNAYAVVVGVERYSAGLPAPTGARADAERFASLAKSSLGLSPDHVQLVVDEQAGKAGVERGIEWVRSSVPTGGRIYFYFSGHGAPDSSGGAPYIVPADGDPKYLDATAIPMKEVLTKLGQSKAREVLAIVDSCFSGAGGRSVLPPGARPIVRVREETAPAQLALFSASSGSEISGPTSSGTGGLFTKVLLDGLDTGAADINGDGQVSLQELSTWVGPRVSREAKKDNRDQNPSLTVGKGLGSADSFIVEWGLAAK